MIRIERGDEQFNCPKLQPTREAELGRVEAEIAAGVVVSGELLGKRYQEVRGALYTAQHRKCCYCESKCNSARWHTVEHFRPKLRYWWLTWTWDNLLFACHDCNNAKRDAFPLAEGSTPLEPRQAPPGAERPALIDPAADDPRTHIRFVPLQLGRWYPVDRSERGQAMLIALGWNDADALAQDGLVEQWQDHVASLEDVVRELRRAFTSEDGPRIRQTWTELTRRRRRASQPFVALTLDVLEWYLGREIERYALPLTVIPTPLPSPAHPWPNPPR